jgi:hypothetical protein
MAFNFRPKSEAEVKAKKKPYSLHAGKVFTFIKKQYGETIVLDPNKDFSDIKIPRAVEKRENIKTVKERLSKAKIDISKLRIQFGNGSGSGKMDAAADTPKQENATRFVCEQVIEKGKFPRDSEIEKIYPKYDDEWYETFKMQAYALKKWLRNTKGYEYSRDTGIMPVVEGVAKKCGIGTKDSWNPADIYLVKKSKRRDIEKKLVEIGDRTGEKDGKLDALNEYMRELFVERNLIGISLKKLGNKVSLEETNVGGAKVEEIKLVKDSIRCDLDLDNKGEFNTGEMAFAIVITGKNMQSQQYVNVQIRAFSGGERESTQMDMTGSGAAAKLGKVSSIQAIDPFLRKLNLKRRMGTSIPKVGKFTPEQVQFYEDEQKKLSTYRIDGNKVYFGKKPWSVSFANARQLEVDNNRTASQLSAKLQCFQWIEMLHTMDKAGKLTEFLNVAYYGAKKQYATAGPFLKIS